MKDYLVKDLMVTLSEYATVKVGATVLDAVLALEKAQEGFNQSKYRHRGVLVLDKHERVIGKVGQMDVLRALEPQAGDLEDIKALSQFSFSNKFIWKLRALRKVQKGSLRDFCMNITTTRVEKIMQAPEEGEFIDQNETLDNAAHQLGIGHHLSLLVTHKERIKGILRMTDVFAAVVNVMKDCKNDLKKGENRG